MKKTILPNVDFDEYADNYENTLQKQLQFFSDDRSYFSEYKTQIVAKYCKKTPQNILDFGCGIGLSLPHLISHFPAANLYATDTSKKSLAYVQRNYPNVTTLHNSDLKNHQFDLIFVACVFHHIFPAERPSTVKYLETLLHSSGNICIFEHNPYNPITRKMVANCPFDKGVELITAYNMKRLILQETTLHIDQTGYCLFFPPALSYLKPLERGLYWLPLGGQYFVMANKI